MHTVFLFGSRDVYNIPPEIVNHLEEIIKQTNGEVRFIVGDANGVDAAFHKTLSSIGARSKTEIYCMDSPRNNKWELPLRVFKSFYDSDKHEVRLTGEGIPDTVIENVNKPEDVTHNRSYYEFKDKMMREACTFAICLWDKKSRGTFTNINVLKAQGKYVYVYTIQ